MRIPTPYQCYLEVLDAGKGVPYFSGVRSDGGVNHGFRSLKGRTAEVADIPEVADDPALAQFLAALNEDDTAFFTVGCLSGRVEDDQGHRMSGYVEFSINDRELVGDAVNYFRAFWQFTQALKPLEFTERVTLEWQLQGASFSEAGCHGMTCAVVINTHYHSSADGAYGCWRKTLELLGSVLTERRGMPLDRLY